MAIHDLRSIPHDTALHADIAIVGGGPAGLTIAKTLENTEIRILIIESGGFEYDADTQALNRVENVGEPIQRKNAEPMSRGYKDNLVWVNDVPAFELRDRIVGGSSHTWMGKCAAFDEMDFAARPWLPVSGWPMPRGSLDSALERAGEILNLGPNVYDERLREMLRSGPPDLKLDPQLLRPFFWQYSHEKQFRGGPRRFANVARDLTGANIDFLTHATVTEINLNGSATKAKSLEVKDINGNRAVVRAETIVLCAGGIENARLLLMSNSVVKPGIGNGRDVVGRYLSDHPRTQLARYTGGDIQAVARHFNFFALAGGGMRHVYLHGLSLSPDIQTREGLVNCAIYPVETPAADDPWVSLRRLARGSRRIGDVVNVVSSMPLVASGLYDRLIHKRGLPHKSLELSFDGVAEQQLNPESRVTLSDTLDRLGRPIPRVDWKIGSSEIASMKRLSNVISDEFVRIGLPKPQLPNWIVEDDDSKAAFMDMAHPSSTTRMGTNPANSVVDPNSMVHGVAGLFVSGSSVFPTGGHANPTLMILAMAIRLADHLKARHRGESPEDASYIPGDGVMHEVRTAS